MGLKSVYVPKKKLKYYLLSNKHQKGKSKFIFFKHIGFDSRFSLTKALSDLARSNKIKKRERTKFGTKYVIEGTLYSQSRDKEYKVQTVWIKTKNSKRPRLVSARPVQNLI